MASIRRWLLISSAFALGISAGCLLQLDRELACGDGFVDASVGEGCDPNDPLRGFEDECVKQGFPGGVGQCDPQTCQVVVDPDTCQFCGDQIVTGDEPCDGGIGSCKCPDGTTAKVSCTADCACDLSQCEPCGNGEVDPGEECDPNDFCDSDDDCGPTQFCNFETSRCVYQDGFAGTLACSALEVTADLDKPAYSQGSVTDDHCLDNCKFDRTRCNFCGDGVLDKSEYFDWGPPETRVGRPGEICDGDQADADELEDYCQSICTQTPTVLQLSCFFQCSDSCDGFENPDLVPMNPDPVEDLGCCLKQGETCGVAQAFPCCWELANPGMGTGCINVGGGGLGVNECQ